MDAIASSTLVSETDREFTLTRTFKAPRELVFKTFTDPEMLKKWWGPKGFTTPVWKLEPRVGGEMLFCMKFPPEVVGQGPGFPEEQWVKGVVREFRAPERLAYTNVFVDANGKRLDDPALPREMVTEFDFEEQGGGTKVTLHQWISDGDHWPYRMPPSKGAAIGWGQQFDKLDELLR